MNVDQKLRKYIKLFFISCYSVLFATCMNINIASAEESDKIVDGIPYYFYAIHIEPYNRPTQRAEIKLQYPAVQQMVAKADSYNIKLTLMFAASWVDYILESPERVAEIKAWKKAGHEIGIHRHSIAHGNQHPGAYVGDWDGYSDLPEKEALAQRGALESMAGKREPEPYQGTVNKSVEKLKLINPDINSGCVNDGGSKRALPDAIIYNSCGMFTGFGESGRMAWGTFKPPSELGRNEYISAGIYNGIERKWLNHFFMNPYLKGAEGGVDSNAVAADNAANSFRAMKSGVYGTVNHGEVAELGVFYKYLDFLHSVDPEGIMSKTLSEVVLEKLIPEKRISEAVINVDQAWTGYNEPPKANE